jgi:hypothetical protein
MKTLFYAFGLSALISAGYLSYLCGLQWYQIFTQNENKSTLSVVQKYKQGIANRELNGQQKLSPLVQQA